jgi:hypothetical protein
LPLSATMVSQATRNWPGGARILTHLFPNPSDLTYESAHPTPMIFMLNVHPSRAHDHSQTVRIRTNATFLRLSFICSIPATSCSRTRQAANSLKRVIRFGLDAAPVANIAHEFRDGCGACLFCSRDEHIDKSLIRAHETRTLKLMHLVHPGKASGPASNHALRTHRL